MISFLRGPGMLEIPLNEPAAATHWDELVARCPLSDVYYRAAYVIAAAELEHSEPLGLIIPPATASTSYRCCSGRFPAPMGSLGPTPALPTATEECFALPPIPMLRSLTWLSFFGGCLPGAQRGSWCPASSAPILCLRRIGCSPRLRKLILFSSSGGAKPWPCLFNFGTTLGNALSQCQRGAAPT